MPDKGDSLALDIGGRDVTISNPSKVFFPQIGLTKRDLVEYYLAVGEGALLGVRDRPTVLKRFPNGAEGDFFFQKRAPSGPPWLETVTVAFPSGRSATELCPTDVAHLIWAVNLGCIDLNPWPVRRDDVDHPDELRVDLDPQPGVAFDAVRRVAVCVREVLADSGGLVGWPKTSGSRGIHVNVRIERRYDFIDVRKAVVALAREVERRMPALATSKWWKEERGDRVFLDYNQNARDRTVASVYSVRPRPDARVSAPLTWDEVPDVEPEDLTARTVPARFAALGDVGAGIEDTAYPLDALLELAARDEAAGLGDAPWPPHFAKQSGEGRRVAPSRARKQGPPSAGGGPDVGEGGG